MLGDPAGDALADFQLQTVHNVFVRVLGGSQDQFTPFEHIDQTGIALHNSRSELDHTLEDLVETVRGREADADLVQQIYVRVFHANLRLHDSTYGHAPRCV